MSRNSPPLCFTWIELLIPVCLRCISGVHQTSCVTFLIKIAMLNSNIHHEPDAHFQMVLHFVFRCDHDGGWFLWSQFSSLPALHIKGRQTNCVTIAIIVQPPVLWTVISWTRHILTEFQFMALNVQLNIARSTTDPGYWLWVWQGKHLCSWYPRIRNRGEVFDFSVFQYS